MEKPYVNFNDCPNRCDNSVLSAHTERLNHLITEQSDIKIRLDKMETKYDIMLEMASSLKSLSVQMMNLSDNLAEMKQEVNSDIREIRDDQRIISTKVDRLELSEKDISDSKSSKKQMTESIITSIVSQLLWIIVIIILLALFPHIQQYL